jgi:hypothetical protein
VRAYTSKTVALALRVPDKWVDNLLSHYSLPGVERGRQGVDRRISDTGVLAIQIVRLLSAELSLSVGRATELAADALRSRDGATFALSTPSGIALVLPLLKLEQQLRERIVEAVETVAETRRGRPPATR